jgi:hypothetical protein
MPRSISARRHVSLALAGCLAATTSPIGLCAQSADAPPRDLTQTAAAHYRAYGLALSQGNREQIASFYDPKGALRIFNGSGGVASRAAIDARYRAAWQPPAYFRWDSLAFRALGSEHVLVTGGFWWQGVGQSDTTDFLYTAVPVAVDSGLGITFEQETRWPER